MTEYKKDIMWRTYVVYIGICLFGGAILFQAFKVQFVEGSELKERAKKSTISVKSIEAVRGNIYSRNGSLFATSVPVYDIRMDLKTEALTDEIFSENIKGLCVKLSETFQDKSWQQYKEELTKARARGERYHLIKRNISYTQLQKVKTFPIFKLGQYKGGFIYEQKNKRKQPFWPLAARTIGNYRENSSSVGLEDYYNKELQGVNGSRLMQKIAGGVWMPLNDENEQEPQPGYDIYSTIDVNIQDVAQNALYNQLKLHNADHGCVAVMEVETGKIRAISNLKKGRNDEYYESYNYVVGESTEPGSTFKLASLMVALENGYVSLDDKINTEDGSTKFYDRTMYDSKRGGHGVITLREAFEVSSNVAISKAIVNAFKKNPKEFTDGLYKMNLNTKTGVAIKGEGKPYVKNPQDNTWSGVTLPWMSIGYEIQLTPLQILTFYNAVANGGKMMRPQLAEKIMNKGKLVREVKPEILNPSIASKETIDMVKECLVGVVENGTAKNLKGMNFKIAGKTGTAQIANAKYGYKYESKISYQASFVGYFPAEKPKYSCIVVINAPSNNVYYGNQVAGPIFKEVANKVFAVDLKLHDVLTTQEHQALSAIPYSKSGNKDDLLTVFNAFKIKTDGETSSEWISTSTEEEKVKIKSESVEKNLVPNVVGMGIMDAIYLLENRGLSVKFSGKGIIKNQSLPAGEEVKKGSTIYLELSS
jgi:cell division protein FtsI (penicillin-binding protein 3)